MNTYCLSCKKDTKKSTFRAEPSALARISQGSGIFDSLV